MISTEQFCDEESGAVTVDYVVLTAGLVAVGLAAGAVVSGGVGDLTGQIQEFLLQDLRMTSRFDVNRLTNASFEDIEGMIEAGWGLFASNGALLGWTNTGDTTAELVESGSFGIEASDGDRMLDLESSPGNIALGQAVNGAVAGQVCTATFSAADPIGNNGIEVVRGGEVLRTITPTVGSMSQYSVELTGGSGNGDNMVYPRGTPGCRQPNCAGGASPSRGDPFSRLVVRPRGVSHVAPPRLDVRQFSSPICAAH